MGNALEHIGRLSRGEKAELPEAPRDARPRSRRSPPRASRAPARGAGAEPSRNGAGTPTAGKGVRAADARGPSRTGTDCVLCIGFFSKCGILVGLCREIPGRVKLNGGHMPQIHAQNAICASLDPCPCQTGIAIGQDDPARKTPFGGRTAFRPTGRPSSLNGKPRPAARGPYSSSGERWFVPTAVCHRGLVSMPLWG